MINELILWIADLPNIVRVMFVGAVLGGIGGALGAAMLRGHWPHATVVLTAACAALTLPINNSIITPLLKPLAFKAAFIKGAGNLPRRIDDVTIAEAAGIYDNAMNYTYRLEMDVADLEAAKSNIKQTLAAKPECKTLTGMLNPDVHVEKLVYRYKTNSGDITVELVASDCR